MEGLQKDAQGNIILRPVTGWTTATIAGISVLLAIQYSDSLENIEKPQSLQLGLTAQQALELAETLTKQANRLLLRPGPGSVRH